MASTNGKEYKLAIRIAGTVDKSLSYSLTSAKAQVAALSKDMDTLGKGYDTVAAIGRKGLGIVAEGAKIAATAAIAAGTAATYVGSNFESAFAGVKKTVDATKEEYEVLKNDVIDMSKRIPSTADEIARVMEVSGQLGIGRDNKAALTDFTEVMINMGESTDLIADEAASTLARFANITQMSDYDNMGASNYERLGSTIVDLGNKFATTESEITNMGLNIAAAGSAAGFSEDEILAFAAAASSTGLKAERGGTAISKTIKMLQSAVETGSDSLEEYGKIAGMSAAEFRKAFKDDAGKATAAFIKGLGNTERNGKSVLAMVNELGITETRWSDMLVRMANASNIMDDALNVASEAWEENTALATEAGKRYETFESQISMTGNSIKALGIEVYEEVTRAPILSLISDAREAIDDFSDNQLGEWIDKINEKIPTLVREGKDLSKYVVNVAIEGGSWIIDNGPAIAGAISGITIAITGFKAAQKGVQFVNWIAEIGAMAGTTMGTIALGIAGVTAAFGVLEGIAITAAIDERKAINQNLADHFGNISLSIDDLNDAAEKILNSGRLSGINKQLEQLDKAKDVAKGLDNITDNLDKYNWMVNVGIGLTEDERSDYQTQIDSYIKSANEYVLQQQYAVNVGTNLVFGDASTDRTGIGNFVRSAYSSAYTEMQGLGTSLSEAVNEAMKDGILDPDEVIDIENYMSKMAELQQRIAEAESNANYQILSEKYGKDLTAESFMNLKSELDEQEAADLEKQEEAHRQRLTSIEYARSSVLDAYNKGNASEDDVDAANSKYNAAMVEENKYYTSQVAETKGRKLDFVTGTINDAYRDSVDEIISSIAEKYTTDLQNALTISMLNDTQRAEMGYYEDPFASVFGNMMNDLVANSDYKTLQSAVGELMKGIMPEEDRQNLLDSLKETGAQIPEYLSEGITESEYWEKVVSGDTDELWSLIGKSLAEDNPDLAKALEKAKESGSYVPESTSQGIKDNSLSAADDAASTVYNDTETLVQEYFSQGMDVEGPVNITLVPELSESEKAKLRQFQNINLTSPIRNSSTILDRVGYKADGGIVTQPELNWNGEEGPEAIIPLDGSDNALSLWEKTGKLLGIDSLENRYPIKTVAQNATQSRSSEQTAQQVQMTFAPNITIQGNADESVMNQTVDTLREQFEGWMQQYLRNQQRLSY